MNHAPYLLDNAQNGAARRMTVLAELYDGGTRDALAATGLQPGWRCLEVGGGGGTIARWLAGQVGPSGSVLCTDLDPRHLVPGTEANLRVERHDIVSDALPDSSFDLIHARLVLIHLPEREAVLRKLTQALAPGGWLVIEDFDLTSLTPDPSIEAEVHLVTAKVMREFMNRGGVAGNWGRQLYGKFRACSLRDIRAAARLSVIDAHSAGAALMRVNFQQVGDRLVDAGFIDAAQLRRDIEHLDREDFAVPSPVMWSVSGRR